MTVNDIARANIARLPVRLRRFGLNAPLPERRVVRAGPIIATVEGGDLRYLTVGGREVVRRIYVAVRDRNWGTVAARYSNYTVQDRGDSFSVSFTAEHVEGDVDFAWEGRIEGTSDGVITCEMDGLVRRRFLKNRIGWCVLHPLALAGQPVAVDTPDGKIEGAFPERISPTQPFVDMVGIAYAAGPEATLAIRFEGDLFEMEDQRNWTDASFKTYSTPLRLPYPMQVEVGRRISQVVRVSSEGDAREPVLAPPHGPVEIHVGGDARGALPAIGLGAASHGKPLTADEPDRLLAVRPAHLRVELDLSEASWPERLRQMDGEAAVLGAALELEVIAGDAGEGLEALLPTLKDLGVPVARLLVFPRSGWVTTEPVLAVARDLMRQSGLDIPLGGGSRTYFTELNRAELPLEQMDVVGYTLNPQVHAFDNASLVETLAGQAATVESARAIAGGRPLAVGPITLKPRFNPNATGAARKDPNRLPAPVDRRQLSLFGAGWTVGSVHRLSEAGADSLTYFETTGWRGVMEQSGGKHRDDLFPWLPGALFPLYHVLADVGEFASGEFLPVTLGDPLAVEALALRQGQRVRVLVASFRDEPTAATVHVPSLERLTVRLLDEDSYAQAALDGVVFRRTVEPAFAEGGVIRLDLKPFAIVCVDGWLTEDAIDAR